MKAKQLAQMNAVRGMTFREYAAVAAMRGILAKMGHPEINETYLDWSEMNGEIVQRTIAREARFTADALIEELAKEKRD